MSPVFVIFFTANVFEWTAPSDGELVTARRDGSANAAISGDPTFDPNAASSTEGIMPADNPYVFFWSQGSTENLPVGRPVRRGESVYFSADNGCLVTLFFQQSAE